MSERMSSNEDDYNKSDSRRSFLKKLGIIGAGTAIAGTGIYAAKKHGENEKEEIIEKLTNSYQEKTAQENDTLWGFYQESGWREQNVSELAYYEAAENLNPEAEELNKRTLIAGHSYKLPWFTNDPE